MDVKETNTILRYKRPCDSWLCPDCDTENNIALGRCTVCGCKKSSTATILKQWTEADEKPVMLPKITTTSTTPTNTSAYRDTKKDSYISEEESSKNIIIAFVVIAIILFVFIVAVSQGYYF